MFASKPPAANTAAFARNSTGAPSTSAVALSNTPPRIFSPTTSALYKIRIPRLAAAS